MDLKKQTKLIDYLTASPDSDRKAIEKGTKIKGILLTNHLKRLEEGGLLSFQGEGKDMKFSIKAKPAVKEKANTESPNAGDTDAVSTEEKQKGEVKTKTNTSSRDNRKFKFEGQEYGKGPLVRAVVGAYVKKNPKTTIAQLKKVFPDDLLKRYGIFMEVKEAKKMSGNRDRYFLKPDQVIPLKDGSIAVCNQFTSENIQPFLKMAKDLGFTIK